uniref:Uncharacterized protein n=1 Tax=Picea glauca TaxID=3330 RepID=A0A124GNF2_PICGL|nr:hypothetical protein ABT39_MTgene4633 [Picea glauca]
MQARISIRTIEKPLELALLLNKNLHFRSPIPYWTLKKEVVTFERV